MSLSGCVDDEIYNPEEIGEGVANVTATVNFDSYVPSLTTRAEAGNIIHDINDMMVFVYDANDYDEEESQPIKTLYFDQNTKDWILQQNGNSQTPGDVKDDPAYDAGENNPHWTDENTTPRASFEIKNLNFGKYYIYVAANVGKLSEELTPYQLKHYTLDWNNQTISANNQMFGYFTLDNPNDQSSAGFQSKKPVIINAPEVKLHAWIKRAVSKVTIAYDATDLNESVFIYIKKATIRDVPLTCLLGADNVPDSYEDLYIAPGYGKTHKECYGDAENPDANVSQTISYVKAGTDQNKMDNWLVITKGAKVVGSKDHLNADEALFFYENMQGDWSGKGEAYNKKMQPEVTFGDTPIRVPAQADFKDRVPYGTYIEVEGYYESRNSDRVTRGNIKYRFMLGKNTTYNYDAARNHHYKLTLKFNGFANEADWHIDYVVNKPAINVPSKFYVPYVYGTRAGEGMPVRLEGKPISLMAEIIENNWAPYSDDPSDSKNGVLTTDHPGGDFYWNLNAYNFLNNKYNSTTYFGHANFVGFLSLREVNQAYIFDTEPKADAHGYGEEMMGYLQEKYENGNAPLYRVTYDNLTPGTHPINPSDASDGTYAVKEDVDKDKTVTVMIPMWTRNKSMGRMTGFTGNNPYAPYMRKAIVRITATFDNEGPNGEPAPYTTSVEVPVFQVRRIENPKGIWYSKDCTDKFDVTLYHWADPEDTEYSEFDSEGKWRVSVEPINGVSPDWVLINGSALKNGSYVEGSTGTPIKFSYQPSGKATKDRCAVITVEYHDYTCVHKIFVRQGFEEDIELNETAKKNGKVTLWSSHNVYGFVAPVSIQSDATPPSSIANNQINEVSCRVTKSPLSIGSLFKRGQYNYAVLEENNIDWGFDVVPGDLKTGYYSDKNVSQMTIRSKSWSTFGGVAATVYASSTSRKNWEWAPRLVALNSGNQVYRVPGYEDFDQLLSNDIDFGYGIVYSDGAIKVNQSVKDAESYHDYENKGVTNGSGVKACIVYNSKTANQILFSMGGAGYGRRRRNNSDNPNDLSMVGNLLYAGVNYLLSSNANFYRPIVYNLMYSNGAVYWTNKIEPEGHRSDGADAQGWDMNYFSFDFGAYDNGVLGEYHYNSQLKKYVNVTPSSSSDALPIKLVRDR